MNDFKINNAWICKVENNQLVPVFGDLHISNGRIFSIKTKKFKTYLTNNEKQKAKNIYDAEGRVITIPLVNYHDHFYSRLAKGLRFSGEMNNFHNILKKYWWKVDKALDLPMVEASAQMAVIESIKNGVTYIFDHHASPNATRGSLSTIAGVLKSNNLRGVLCFETTDRNGTKLTESGLNENESFLTDSVDDDIKSMLGLHASFTLADDTLAEAEKLVKDYDLGIHIHLCEDLADRKISKQISGKFPVRRLINFNLLNMKSILAHGIHLTKQEYQLINEYGSALAYNVDSNLNNSVGLPKYRNVPEGIPIVLGTDGMHANPGRTMKNYFLLLRHFGFSFDESFKMIHKVFLDQLTFIQEYFDDFPTLRVNDRADLIIWDYIPPTPLTKDNFWGHYIYGMLERAIQSTIQHGEFLMKDKKLIGIDEGEINKEIYKQGDKLFYKF
ncbi:8-oxoguanine deaminase [bacterium BMS3Abin04]|nr:8-oxoguanine deaminase [bacterium BMS3Abin04]